MIFIPLGVLHYMATADLSNYKTLYLQTAKEYVVSLSAGCDKLISDPQDKDAVNQIHIASHSLKSQSQVMEFMDIANLCVGIEKTSNDLISGIGKVDDAFIVLLKKTIDGLNSKLTLLIKKGDAETSSA